MKPAVSRAMSRPAKSARGWNSISVDSESIDVSTLDQKFHPFLLPFRIADKHVYRPVPKQLSKALRLKRVSSQPLTEPSHGELTGHAERDGSYAKPLDAALEKMARKKKIRKDAKIKRRTERSKKKTNVIECPQSLSRCPVTAEGTSSPTSLAAAETATKQANKEATEAMIETELRPGVLKRVVRSFKSRKTTPNVRIEVTDSITEGETPARATHEKASDGIPSPAIHKEESSGVSLEREKIEGSFGGSTDLVKFDCGVPLMENPEAWPQGPIMDLESSANFCTSPEAYGIMDDFGDAFYRTMSRLAIYPEPSQPVFHSSRGTTTTSSCKNDSIKAGNDVDIPESRDDDAELIRSMNRKADDCHDPACTERREQSFTDIRLGGGNDDEGLLFCEEERSAPKPDKVNERKKDESHKHHPNKSGSSKEPLAMENVDTFHESYLLGYLLGILALQRSPRSPGRRPTDQKCSRLVFVHEGDQAIELEAVLVRDGQNDPVILSSDQDVTASSMKDQTQTKSNAPNSPTKAPEASKDLNEEKLSVQTQICPQTSSDASLVFSAATPIEEIVNMVHAHPAPHLAKGFLVYILTKFSKQAKSVDHGGLHMGFARCLSEDTFFPDSGHDPMLQSGESSVSSFVNRKQASSMLSEIVKYALSLASASHNPGSSLHDRETNKMTDEDLESILASVESSLTRISQLPKGNTGHVMMSDLSLSSGTCDSWTSDADHSGSDSLSCSSSDADEDDSDDDDDGVSSASSSGGADWLGILASSYDSIAASDDRILSFDVTELMLRE